MKAKCIASDGDRELLEYNGFSSFESLWEVKLDWFEEPNHRRHGWSGVSQHVLKRPEGGSLAVFIKRQQNHNFKSLLHPMRGLPTVYREYRNICKLKEYGIPCPDPVFYGHRSHGRQWQAILMTRSLTGYKPLEDSLNSIEQDDVDVRRALLASVAQTLSRMHGRYLRHSCLYAKHIFVRGKNCGSANRDGICEFDSAVIDLEKMRTGFPLSRLILHDLDTLSRHWNRGEGDWEAFFDSYVACMKSGFLGRKVTDAVIRRSIADCRTSRIGHPAAGRTRLSIPASPSLIPGGKPGTRLR